MFKCTRYLLLISHHLTQRPLPEVQPLLVLCFRALELSDTVKLCL